MPTARLIATVLDCADPGLLGRFYAGLIGGTVAVDDDDWAQVNGPEGRAVLACQRVEGYLPPTWPTGSRPQYLHLDFGVEDLAAAAPDVIALGATKAPEQPNPDEFWVYLDPAGHPFCTVLVAPAG